MFYVSGTIASKPTTMAEEELMCWLETHGIIEITGVLKVFKSYNTFIELANDSSNFARAEIRRLMCDMNPKIEGMDYRDIRRRMQPVVDKLKGHLAAGSLGPGEIGESIALAGLESDVARMRATLWPNLPCEVEEWVNPACTGGPAAFVMKNMDKVGHALNA